MTTPPSEIGLFEAMYTARSLRHFKPDPVPEDLISRVLDAASSNSGLIRTMHMIHGTMMIPVWGRSIVGWLGVAMLFSCFTGIWLWWPTVGKWVRGLRWRRHRNLDTNLHHLFGFWIALPLFARNWRYCSSLRCSGLGRDA